MTNVTHYNGRKIPIVLIPYSIKSSSVFFENDHENGKKIPFSTLTNYQLLSSIVYPDLLFFYDKINSQAFANSKYKLNDLFYSVSDINDNRLVIENLKNTLSEEQYNTYNRNALTHFREEYNNGLDNYSMIELFLLLSNGLNFKWYEDTLYIIEENQRCNNSEETILEGILSKDIKKCSAYGFNIEKFWKVLQERISYKDLVTTDSLRYFIDMCQYDTNQAIAL